MPKPTTVFIKTWINDLPWLRYCLASISKYWQGSDIVLVADEDCRPTIDSWSLNFVHVRYVPNPTNGYIQQQAIKLQAHHYTDAEYILYIDSDTVFVRPSSIEDFVTNYQVNLIMELYSRLGDAVPWKAITERHIGYPVKYEFMRRFPIVHHRSVLEEIEVLYPQLQQVLATIRSKKFSEFNFMGAHAYHTNNNFYNFVPYPNYPLPEISAKQFWSWGGLKPEIEAELQRITQ